MFEKRDGNTMDILFLIQSVNREKINMISLFLAEIFEFFVFRKSAPRRTFLKSTTQISFGSRNCSMQHMIKIFLHRKDQVQNYIRREKFVMLALILRANNFYVNLVPLFSKGL